MPIEHILLILVTGLVAGFLNTVAGGGSLLTLPMLIFLGLPSAMANGTNRVAIFFQNATAIYGFRSSGVSDFRFSWLITVPALIGAWVGAQIAIDLDDAIFNKLLAVIMLAVAAYTIFGSKPKDTGAHSTSDGLWTRENIISMVVFFFLGVYGGFIQAGIGFLILGALTAVKKFDLIKANAVKVFVIFFYTIIALGAFILSGKVDWQLGLTLAVGNAGGAWIGTRFAVLKGSKAIRWVLVVAVVAFSIKLFFVQ